MDHFIYVPVEGKSPKIWNIGEEYWAIYQKNVANELSSRWEASRVKLFQTNQSTILQNRQQVCLAGNRSLRLFWAGKFHDDNNIFKALIWHMWTGWSCAGRAWSQYQAESYGNNQGVRWWGPALRWEYLWKVCGDIVSTLIAYLLQFQLPATVCLGY